MAIPPEIGTSPLLTYFLCGLESTLSKQKFFNKKNLFIENKMAIFIKKTKIKLIYP